MNSVSKKKWKSLVAIAKTAGEFSGKTGDSYDGRGYFPNKNMSTAVKNSMVGSAKMQGKALVPKMESQYDDEGVWNKGTRYYDVPKNMIKHKLDDKVKQTGKRKFINTENKMKYIFGESKMKKSEFNNLVRSIISEVIDVLEGKGAGQQQQQQQGGGAPKITQRVSKGGFTLKDFSAVLGGVGGRQIFQGEPTSREKGYKPGGGGIDKGEMHVQRGEIRQFKLSLFNIDKGKSIDAWRTMVLLGSEDSMEKGKYQRRGPGGEMSGYKTKSTTSDIDSLASIRNTDDAFRKTGGGAKRGGTESFKVSAKYISAQTDSINMYNDVIDNEIVKLRELQQNVEAGDKNYVALENLIEDLGLKKDEYSLKWDYAVAAYSNNTATMATVRSNIEAKRDVILKRAKNVGGAVSDAAWKEDTSYNWGDRVTGSDGKIYIATDNKETPASKLGQSDPASGSPIWIDTGEEGNEGGNEGGNYPTWEERGQYSFGDTVTGRSGRTYLAMAPKRGEWREGELGEVDPETNHPMWVAQ